VRKGQKLAAAILYLAEPGIVAEGAPWLRVVPF